MEKALQALATSDPAICDQVIRGDDEVDKLYLDVERRILHLFALQTPVATDLRLLTALLHINLHLERVGDQAVNIAKIARLTKGLPQIPEVLQDLEEMGKLSLRMVRTAMDALARRDLELAGKLPELDDPIDQLNRGMLPKMLEASDDKRLLEWGIRMYVVSRQIERIGDNAVTSASRWPSWSPASSGSSPMPHTQRSNTPSSWDAERDPSRTRTPFRPPRGVARSSGLHADSLAGGLSVRDALVVQARSAVALPSVSSCSRG